MNIEVKYEMRISFYKQKKQNKNPNIILVISRDSIGEYLFNKKV